MGLPNPSASGGENVHMAWSLWCGSGKLPRTWVVCPGKKLSGSDENEYDSRLDLSTRLTGFFGSERWVQHSSVPPSRLFHYLWQVITRVTKFGSCHTSVCLFVEVRFLRGSRPLYLYQLVPHQVVMTSTTWKLNSAQTAPSSKWSWQKKKTRFLNRWEIPSGLSLQMPFPPVTLTIRLTYKPGEPRIKLRS